MAVQINLSDLKNHVGKKVKIFCKVLSTHSSSKFVIGDKTDYKLLLANENFSNKHLQTGNFIKILKPEISTNEEEEVTIKIGENTSIFSSPKIDGIVTPPDDHPFMKNIKESTPIQPPKIQTIDELKNTLKIASTLRMEKCKVKFLFIILYSNKNFGELYVVFLNVILAHFFSIGYFFNDL